MWVGLWEVGFAVRTMFHAPSCSWSVEESAKHDPSPIFRRGESEIKLDSNSEFMASWVGRTLLFPLPHGRPDGPPHLRVGEVLQGLLCNFFAAPGKSGSVTKLTISDSTSGSKRFSWRTLYRPRAQDVAQEMEGKYATADVIA